VRRERVEHLGAVVRPEDGLKLVAVAAALHQRPLLLHHVDLDADALELLRDHLTDAGERDELAGRCHQLHAQAALAILAQAEALGVLLGQPDLVEELVRLSQVRDRPLRAVLGAGAVERVVGGGNRAERPDAEPERLVELVAVDAERQGVSKSPISGSASND
jgi:hypothetical protein